MQVAAAAVLTVVSGAIGLNDSQVSVQNLWRGAHAGSKLRISTKALSMR